MYRFTLRNFHLNAEYKARRHFNQYARPGSKIYNSYLKNLYRIPDYFDEKSYKKYANLDENINLEELYLFFINNFNKDYPLDDNYDRILFNIDKEFNADAYYKRYKVEIDNYNYEEEISLEEEEEDNDNWDCITNIGCIKFYSNVWIFCRIIVNC